MARSNRIPRLQDLLLFEYSWSSGTNIRVIRLYIGAGLVVLALLLYAVVTNRLPVSTLLQLIQ